MLRRDTCLLIAAQLFFIVNVSSQSTTASSAASTDLSRYLSTGTVIRIRRPTTPIPILLLHSLNLLRQNDSTTPIPVALAPLEELSRTSEPDITEVVTLDSFQSDFEAHNNTESLIASENDSLLSESNKSLNTSEVFIVENQQSTTANGTDAASNVEPALFITSTLEQEVLPSDDNVTMSTEEATDSSNSSMLDTTVESSSTQNVLLNVTTNVVTFSTTELPENTLPNTESSYDDELVSTNVTVLNKTTTEEPTTVTHFTTETDSSTAKPMITSVPSLEKVNVTEKNIFPINSTKTIVADKSTTEELPQVEKIVNDSSNFTEKTSQDISLSEQDQFTEQNVTSYHDYEYETINLPVNNDSTRHNKSIKPSFSNLEVATVLGDSEKPSLETFDEDLSLLNGNITTSNSANTTDGNLTTSNGVDTTDVSTTTVTDVSTQTKSFDDLGNVTQQPMQDENDTFTTSTSTTTNQGIQNITSDASTIEVFDKSTETTLLQSTDIIIRETSINSSSAEINKNTPSKQTSTTKILSAENSTDPTFDVVTKEPSALMSLNQQSEEKVGFGNVPKLDVLEIKTERNVSSKKNSDAINETLDINRNFHDIIDQSNPVRFEVAAQEQTPEDVVASSQTYHIVPEDMVVRLDELRKTMPLAASDELATTPTTTTTTTVESTTVSSILTTVPPVAISATEESKIDVVTNHNPWTSRLPETVATTIAKLSTTTEPNDDVLSTAAPTTKVFPVRAPHRPLVQHIQRPLPARQTTTTSSIDRFLQSANESARTRENGGPTSCPRREDIHPCQCLEVPGKTEPEMETVAFCKNIRNHHVLTEAIRGFQGHKINFFVFDSCKLPPFPNALLNKVDVEWMEIINSTIQFQKEFLQCAKGCR